MPPSMLLRRWFYKTYNWSPEVVDNIPLDDFNWLPIIENADNEAREYHMKQQQKSSQHQPSKPRPIQGF